MRNFNSIETIQSALFEHQYVAQRDLATSIFLSLNLKKPLFLEGEAGVGKTEVGKVLASILGVPLIRLQCYEGLDVHNAVYEWDYPRQILHLRMLEANKISTIEMEEAIYSRKFLLSRPLLQAIENQDNSAPVLLIDEIDRADEEFESFLLELLSEYQITIPEIGTIKAEVPPVVVITSNRTREVHDALKRRCLYQWIEYPSFETEFQILNLKVPGLDQQLSHQIVSNVQRLREADLFKAPGIAETLDWGRAVESMDRKTLDEETINATLGVVLKYRDDILQVKERRITQHMDEQSHS
ncbi:MAG: MoxR family ATPase [Anaerolineales bacterium]|nr:MoxR family ATPase [Anaerolineales bacterium]